MSPRAHAALLSVAAGLVLSCEPEPTGSGGDGGGVDTPQVCKDFCELEVSCDQVDRQECEDGCQDYYEMSVTKGPACVQSFQDLFGCVAGLDCDGFHEWLDSPPDSSDEYPCSEQDGGYEVNC